MATARETTAMGTIPATTQAIGPMGLQEKGPGPRPYSTTIPTLLCHCPNPPSMLITKVCSSTRSQQTLTTPQKLIVPTLMYAAQRTEDPCVTTRHCWTHCTLYLSVSLYC